MPDRSARGDIILDAFLGGGTTLIAADGAGGRCYGLEFDPGQFGVLPRRAAPGRDRIAGLRQGRGSDYDYGYSVEPAIIADHPADDRIQKTAPLPTHHPRLQLTADPPFRLISYDFFRQSGQP